MSLSFFMDFYIATSNKYLTREPHANHRIRQMRMRELRSVYRL